MIQLSIVALGLVLALSSTIRAQQRSNAIAAYLDPHGSVCNRQLDLSQSFEAYIIASNLTDYLQSIDFRVSHCPQLQVIEREVNATAFSPSMPLVLDGGDEWSLQTRECMQLRNVVLVRYRLQQLVPGEDLTVCAEPTTVNPQPPTYVDCTGVEHPMQPAFPGALVQEGCSVINSSSAEGGIGPIALCEGTVPRLRSTWSRLKTHFRD